MHRTAGERVERGSDLHSVYHCFHMGDRLSASARQDEDGGVREAALKVVGACAGSCEEAFIKDEELLARLGRAVCGMAIMDPAPVVRALAQKMAQLIFPPQ